MNVIGQFDFEIICFIKKVGSLLRVIKLSYDRLVPNDVVSAIVTHCSNAEKLELEGAAYDVESVKSLYPTFRRMPNLGLVLFRNWFGCGTADPVTLVYCNNKMALEGYHFPGGKSLNPDSDWKLSVEWRQDI
ncbi:hypothetical protein HDE_12812 [Halotydeus destructor]|nr:hypothetical protein HDE_12812 [Halotydeus destructor]